MSLIFKHVATELFPAIQASRDEDESYYGRLVGRLEALLADLDKTLMSKDYKLVECYFLFLIFLLTKKLLVQKMFF